MRAAELGKKILPLLLKGVANGAPPHHRRVQYLDSRDAVPLSTLPEQKVSQLCSALAGGGACKDGKE